MFWTHAKHKYNFCFQVSFFIWHSPALVCFTRFSLSSRVCVCDVCAPLLIPLFFLSFYFDSLHSALFHVCSVLKCEYMYWERARLSNIVDIQLILVSSLSIVQLLLQSPISITQAHTLIRPFYLFSLHFPSSAVASSSCRTLFHRAA